MKNIKEFKFVFKTTEKGNPITYVIALDQEESSKDEFWGAPTSKNDGELIGFIMGNMKKNVKKTESIEFGTLPNTDDYDGPPQLFVKNAEMK